jgi:hypothetical protein
MSTDWLDGAFITNGIMLVEDGARVLAPVNV